MAYPWLYNPTDPSTFLPLNGPHPVTLRINLRNSLRRESALIRAAGWHSLAVDALLELAQVRQFGKRLLGKVLGIERRQIRRLLDLQGVSSVLPLPHWTHLVDVCFLVLPSPSRQASLFMSRSIRPALGHNALQHLIVEQAGNRDVLVRIRLLILIRQNRNVGLCGKINGRACGEGRVLESRLFRSRRWRGRPGASGGGHGVALNELPVLDPWQQYAGLCVP